MLPVTRILVVAHVVCRYRLIARIRCAMCC